MTAGDIILKAVWRTDTDTVTSPQTVTAGCLMDVTKGRHGEYKTARRNARLPDGLKALRGKSGVSGAERVALNPSHPLPFMRADHRQGDACVSQAQAQFHPEESTN